MATIHMNGTAMSPENAGGGGTVKSAPRLPYLEIVEQPASKALRFRYECEGRSAGSIPGIHNTPEHKTYPTVRIVGYRGRAVIIVSCVTKDEPYRVHPHNLVGKEGCKDGICTMEVNNENMTATFSNLGIQCVKKKDIEDALRVRKGKRVDPFKEGFSHSTNASSIDLNAVRLCFQAFLGDVGTEPQNYVALQPIVSDVIYDKKAMSDLVITKLSHSSAPATSRQEVILLCEKVAKEDIQVRFFEEIDGNVVWEGLGDFTPSQVHKQVAIWFKTPVYPRNPPIGSSVNVFIQMRRPSDGTVSDPLPFKFTPDDTDMIRLRGGKRPRTADYNLIKMNPPVQPNQSINVPPTRYQLSPQPPFQPIKEEPYPSPTYMPSPQYNPIASPGNSYPVYAQPPLPSFLEINLPREQRNPSPGFTMIPHQEQATLQPLANTPCVQENIVSSGGLTSWEERISDLIDPNALSQNLFQSLNLAPDAPNTTDEPNMTDSLTKLIHEEVDKMEGKRQYKQL